MQIIHIARDSLLRPLQLVSGIVERRHTLPILANVYLRKEGERITFISTDIEMQIATTAVIGSGSDNLTVTIGARKLLDILNALPKDGVVSLTITDKRATLQSGKSHFTLQTLEAEDFPLVKSAEDAGAAFKLPQKTFRALLNQVHFAMAVQDIRYYLNGLLFSLDGNRVSAVATDGHRLALSALTTEESFTKQEVIVPRKTISQLLYLLGDVDDPVTIQIAANQIRFTTTQVEIVSKLVEGKFPDFNRVLPKGHKNIFSLSRVEFLQSLQRIAILTSEKFRAVRWVLETNSITLSSTNNEHEEASEEISIEYGGAALEIGFNVSYLLDVLNNLKSDQVSFALGEATSSALLTVTDDPNFNYVLMPMRI